MNSKEAHTMKLHEGQPWILPRISDGEMKRRHGRLIEEMKKRNIGCLVIGGSQVNYGAGSDNVRYLSHYGIFYGEGYIVFPLSGEPKMFCRSKNQEFNARSMSCIATQISGYPIFGRDVSNYIKELKLDREKIGIVGIEIMPGNFFLDLQQRLPEAQFHFVSEILSEMRFVKGPEELAFVEKAGEIADYCYEAMLMTAKPGCKEYEVYAAVEQALTSHGANAPSFVLLNSGPAPMFPPAPSSHRILQLHDTILNEISPCYGGHWIQWGRAISIGEPTKGLDKLYEVTMEVYYEIEKAIKPGISYEDLAKGANDLIESKGYTWLAPPTQLIGMDITEGASMAKGTPGNIEMVPRPLDKRPLEPGMVIVNQPNIVTKDFTKGMLVIDTVIVTDQGCKVVTKAPLEYGRV
jgi:Xaa-Pro dipeptidase